MYKHYQDALAICRVYGNPQYFITFTCNVRWPEFVRFTQQNQYQKIQDRPDIISTVFRMKVAEFIKFIREDFSLAMSAHVRFHALFLTFSFIGN